MHTITLELTDLQVSQLRQVMDDQPLRPYAPLIVAVLAALPLESAAVPSSADRSLLDLQVPGSRGGVSIGEQIRNVLQTSYTQDEPLDQRRGEPAIVDND